MFTGLVRAFGELAAVRDDARGRHLAVNVAGLRPEDALPGSSIAVNGVCLTVTRADGGVAWFDVTVESVRRSTFKDARVGARVNLEPALRLGDALDGHWVLGHVDAVAPLMSRREARGSEILRFGLPPAVGGWIAEKGSVALDGVSLTISALDDDAFEISVIPETLARTTLGTLRPGTPVNLEVDALARYATRWLAWTARSGGTGGGGDAVADAASWEALLRENGFA